MPKISITKKTAWSLILNINANPKYKTKKNIIDINEDYERNTLKIRYNRKKNRIEDSNIDLKNDIENFFMVFLLLPLISGGL